MVKFKKYSHDQKSNMELEDAIKGTNKIFKIHETTFP